MHRRLITDEWAREYHAPGSSGFADGIMLTPLTFCGVLEQCYDSIAEHWNGDTRSKYDRDYNNVILPHFRDHNTKIVSEYTKEDCDAALMAIQEDGFTSCGMKKKYSEAQMRHFKYLIYIVFHTAARVGFCYDFLWGTQYEITEDRERVAVQSKTRLKKSLSILQEKRFAEALMEDLREQGQRIALLLMFSLGLRDGEACGLDFGDIYELPSYKGCYVAMVKQSTIPNTNELQSSGKTWNTGRRIPIPSKVRAFLLERKALVESVIKEQGLDISIDRVPVAGRDYLDEEFCNPLTRLKADHVTDAAKEVFREVEIASEVLSTLEAEMEEKISQLEVSEKTVSAYLLRRNFATHLQVLGLDRADIQYLLGHCIEDAYIERSDYTDAELYRISQIMEQRPLLNYDCESPIDLMTNMEKSFSGKVFFQLLANDAPVIIRIYAKELTDTLKIKALLTDEEERGRLSFFKAYKPFVVSKKIDVIRKYVEDYHKA